jgi:hypothetical protein
MYSAGISPINHNMTIYPQNHIQYNTHCPDKSSSTISFSPTLLPPQIQETQMQLSSKFYPTPAHQQLHFPEMNYTNNKDRDQHIQIMTSNSEEEKEDTQKNNKNKWQRIRSTKREKIFQSTHNHPKRHGDKQSIRPSNSTTRNLKQRSRHNSKNTQTATNICTWSTKLLRSD